MVSESAGLWLAACEAASEKVQEAFVQASGRSNADISHVVTAVRVAHLLNEVSIFMHSLREEQTCQDSVWSSVCIHMGICSQYQSCSAACGLNVGRLVLLIKPHSMQLVAGSVTMQWHAMLLSQVCSIRL